MKDTLNNVALGLGVAALGFALMVNSLTLARHRAREAVRAAA